MKLNVGLLVPRVFFHFRLFLTEIYWHRKGEADVAVFSLLRIEETSNIPTFNNRLWTGDANSVTPSIQINEQTNGVTHWEKHDLKEKWER